MIKYTHKLIRKYFKHKGLYWLLLWSVLPFAAPHTAWANPLTESHRLTEQPATILQYGLWPEYQKSFNTAPPRRTTYVSVTAYNSEVGQTDSTPFTTAFGTTVRDGIVATNALPRGTKVRFPEMFGSKVFVVEDRMNARYTSRVDIWMPEKADAKIFGVRYLKMEIL